MATYKPLYIKIGQSGTYSDAMPYGEYIDTREKYGLWVKSVPFVIQPTIKNIVVQDWKDEDGEDTYIPTNPTIKAYDLSVSLIYLWDDGMANTRIQSFVDDLRGKWLQITDTYTQKTYKGAYLVEVDGTPKFLRRGTRDYVEFQAKFKCNYPASNTPI